MIRFASMAAVTVAAIGIVAAGEAFAGDAKVVQKKKKFDTTELTVNAGDSITFVNEDKVKHHVLADGLFEISQKPGAEDTVTVNEIGTFDVICAIHPKMELTLTVK